MATETISTGTAISPTRIMETGLGFWASKVLLTAVNLNLFSFVADAGKTADEVKKAMNLQGRGLYDFLDALVALGFLTREGMGTTAKYGNTPETDLFLDRKKPTYIGGLLVMANNRLYPFWHNLEEALKTGLPQNEVRDGGKSLFEELYTDERRLHEFMAAMAGIQTANFLAFAKQFDFSPYRTHCDIGGAGADLSIQIAMHHPHMQCTSFDLPEVRPFAGKNIMQWGMSGRINIATGNFFTDPFPPADVITMGNILHDWNLQEKKMLINKAYDALPTEGALAVIENVIDDERKENAFGLLMSLNMLIETQGGFDYTTAEFTEWATEAGFTSVSVMPLSGPASALIAYK